MGTAGSEPRNRAHDAFKRAHGDTVRTVEIISLGSNPAEAVNSVAPKDTDRTDAVGKGRPNYSGSGFDTMDISCQVRILHMQQQAGDKNSVVAENEGERRIGSVVESL